VGNLSRLPGLISDYFVVEAIVGSTRTADACKALDRFKRQSVGLWTSRAPLSAASGNQMIFANRMEKFGTLGHLAEIISYGIDAAGRAFVVAPVFDGQGLLSTNAEGHEAERRFLSALRLVERLHAAGVVCGDLCHDSFLMDRGGHMKFIGVMGAFDSDGTVTSALPPPETLPYISPQQRIHGDVTVQSDVYALGVLAFRLFSGRFPPLGEDQPNDRDMKAELEARAAKYSPWVIDVTLKCLRPDVHERYSSAVEVLQTINTWHSGPTVHRTARKDESSPALLDQQTVPSKARRMDVEATRIDLSLPMGSAEARVQRGPPPEEPKPRKGIGSISKVTAMTVAAAIAIAIYLSLPRRSGPTWSDDFNSVPGDIHVGDLGGDSPASRERYFRELVTSDDPLAHDVLIRATKDSRSNEEKELAWKAILDRGRRLGLIRSSDQLRVWVKGRNIPIGTPELEPLLRLLDTGFPLESRIEVLRGVYAKDPKFGTALTSAQALDLKDPEAFHELLATIATDSARVVDARQHHALALMLDLPEISSIFLDDLISVGGQIPDDDLKWLLQELAVRNAPHLQSVADLIITKKIFTGVRPVFLEVLRRKGSAPSNVVMSLVRGVLGTLSLEDVAVFGTWYDRDADQVLFAASLSASDPKISLAAFNALGGKPITDVFVSNLLDFVRTNMPNEKQSVAKLVSSIALRDYLASADFSTAFEGLDKLPKYQDLVLLLLRSDISSVVTEVIQRYGHLLSTSSLLDLLAHHEKVVRLIAVKNLKSANDIGALKILLDSYGKETDPEVRAAYEENISVVKERKG